MKALKLAKQIQLTERMMVSLSIIISESQFLKTNLLYMEDFIWKQPSFPLLLERKQSSRNHGYNTPTQVNPCSETYCNACSICCCLNDVPAVIVFAVWSSLNQSRENPLFVIECFGKYLLGAMRVGLQHHEDGNQNQSTSKAQLHEWSATMLLLRDFY